METTIAVSEPVPAANAGPYELKVDIVANPDFKQKFRRRPAVIHGITLKDMKERQYQFIRENGIGGGNWGWNSIVSGPSGPIGRMSYNGRIWSMTDDDVEVVAEPSETRSYTFTAPKGHDKKVKSVEVRYRKVVLDGGFTAGLNRARILSSEVLFGISTGQEKRIEHTITEGSLAGWSWKAVLA